VLRFSTILLGFVALTGCYYLLLSLSKETWIAFTGTFVLMVNPLFIVLANSFMTDVPFLALSVWSAFFLLRAIEQDSISDLMLGMCFAITALLLRQIALALPLAFLFGYAARFNLTMSIKRLAVCVSPFAVSSSI
jgi:4-amino-4-deoxy-L-arabinose transferase-like glycosyltransferase